MKLVYNLQYTFSPIKTFIQLYAQMIYIFLFFINIFSRDNF